MQIPSKVPRIACIVAFIIAGFITVSAVTGRIVVLPFALVPLAAGVGILRNRVWSAYGFALYSFAQTLPVFLILFRAETSHTSALELVVAAAFSVTLGVLFLFAGKSLASAGMVRGWISPWIAVSVLCSLPLLFLQPFVIPTGAMEDTLLIGDRILVQRFPKPTVVRGDLVVFLYPVDRRQVFVKRIIGVAGDRIRLTKKVVYRNGMALKESYAVHRSDYEDAYRDNFPTAPDSPLTVHAAEMLTKHVVNGEVIVPDGCYFVLGDNRDSSLDSRYWGFVPAGNLIGKPLLIYDSEDQPSLNLTEERLIRWQRIRWKRLFKLL